MKHHLKRQLRRLATERPYQIVAGSAAALVLASGTGALLAAGDDAPAGQRDHRRRRRAGPAPRRRRHPRPGADRRRPPVDRRRATARPGRPRRLARAKASSNPDLTRKAAPKPPSTKVAATTTTRRRTPTRTAARRRSATRSAPAGIERTQDELGAQLGTTEMGTNSAEDTTRVLNAEVKGNPYRTRMFPGTPSPAQMDQLQADVVKAITDGRGVVANIVGDATDTDGGWHSFPRRPLHRRGGLQGQRPDRADRRLGEPVAAGVLDHHDRPGELDRHPGLLRLTHHASPRRAPALRGRCPTCVCPTVRPAVVSRACCPNRWQTAAVWATDDGYPASCCCCTAGRHRGGVVALGAAAGAPLGGAVAGSRPGRARLVAGAAGVHLRGASPGGSWRPGAGRRPAGAAGPAGGARALARRGGGLALAARHPACRWTPWSDSASRRSGHPPSWTRPASSPSGR